jgi:hypothetical protein
MIKGAKMLKLFAAVGMAMCALPVSAAERVSNGQFEVGNVGFTTDMKYSAPTGKVPPAANSFSIGKVPFTEHHAFGYQARGMGNYLIGSGSAAPRGIVWRQTGIRVVPGQEYVFDNWFAALHDDNRPNFEVYVDFNDGEGGRFLGRWAAQRKIGIWQGMEARFVPTRKTITISIKNLTGANVGNNFALDAIRVVTPAEWAVGR